MVFVERADFTYIQQNNIMKKKAKKKIAKKRVTVTAPQAQAIRALAEQLGKLIALSGFRSSFSLTTIAKEKGLSKYLPRKVTNKKESFYEFLRNLYCQKPRTIKILVREILPKAIEKRHEKGDPVLEAEALELSSRLKALNINLELEILAMNLPKERPKTVPPPIAIQKILDAYVLHPSLLPDCKLKSAQVLIKVSSKALKYLCASRCQFVRSIIG